MKIINLSNHTLYFDVAVEGMTSARTDIEIKPNETKEVPIEDNELYIS